MRSSRAPLFLEGALVRTIPDTRPGIGPEHSVAAYGTIADVKAEGGWHYRVKSMHTGRSGPWVPEELFPLQVICYRLLNLVLIFIYSISYLFIYLFICLFVCLFVCLLV